MNLVRDKWFKSSVSHSVRFFGCTGQFFCWVGAYSLVLSHQTLLRGGFLSCHINGIKPSIRTKKLPMFYSESFSFTSYIYIVFLCFGGFCCFLWIWICSFPALLVKETILSELYTLGTFVNHQVSIHMNLYFWNFIFISLKYICLSASTILF